MNFCLIAQDINFTEGMKTGGINGATVWIHHLKHAIEALGHTARLHEVGQTQEQVSDVYIIQSEWYSLHEEELKKRRQDGAKIVVILGHFIGGNYYDPEKIEADVYISTWKGEVIEDFEKRTGKKIHFFPHAFCTDCATVGTNYQGDVVFAGNTYPLRDEGWFTGIKVIQIKGKLPWELNQIYKSALVCPNIHGDFQKGIVATHNSRVAVKAGHALNERVFHVIGSGGFIVCDNNPQLKEFFKDDEIVIAENKKDFQQKIRYYCAHPEEREPFIERGQRRIAEGNTYRNRINYLINLL